MVKTLTVASLIPERNNVDFGNGKLVDMLSVEEMSTNDYAGLMRMKARAESLQESLGTGTDNPERIGQGMDELNALLGELMKRLMPDLDDETLEGTQLGIRVRILEWWHENNQPAPKAPGQESQN